MNLSEEITFYAFRYCLGRQSYVVSIAVDYILNNWSNLSDGTKNLMKKEILNYRDEWGKCGMEMDDQQWQRILDKE